MRKVELRGGALRLRRLALSSIVGTLAIWVIAPSATENAAANGDTRTLNLYHTHTGESIDATFRVDGHYDPAVLAQLNHFLRDWRNNDEISMDPSLFDAIWEAYRTAGATDRIQIYSAYRSPETNAMLRRRSKAVAEHSQHMLGKAMDTTLPGFPMSRIREAAMKLQNGGVGWYPSANFVHIDVGGVRSWPRMPYAQLAELFPDGKTVHIASNGQTLPGYEQARQELAQRGQTELPPAQESGGFLAWLFGGGSSGAGAAHEDEEDRSTAVAAAAPPPAPPVQQQVAAAPQPEPAAPAPQPEPAAPQPAALAYAPPPSQPLDGAAHVDAQAQVAGDRGLAVQPPGQQVASLEPGSGDAPPVDLPLPPRRPAEFAQALDIPLPPARPGTLGPGTLGPGTLGPGTLGPGTLGPGTLGSGTLGPSTLGDMQTASIRFTDAQNDGAGHEAVDATAPDAVSPRAALPAIITQGPVAQRHPAEALAFAPTDGAASTPLVRPMALRAIAARETTVVAVTRSAPTVRSGQPAAICGAQLTGLRAAARLMAAK